VRARGFCAGVVRAIDVVERALALYGAPVYVRRDRAQRYVVESLRRKGAIFVEELAEIPETRAPVISRRMGCRAGAEEAAGRALFVIDHLPAGDQGASRGEIHHRRGRFIVLMGMPVIPRWRHARAAAPRMPSCWCRGSPMWSAGAPDPEPRFRDADDLSVDDMRDRGRAEAPFPAIAGPHREDICYATTARRR